MMLFNVALLPSFISTDRIDLGMAMALVATMLVVLSVVLGIYLFAAEAARTAMTSRRSVQRFNLATATVLGGAAMWIANRQ
ncbi:hypothetical protein [Ruegeria faecimaris]|uniref:hypothetical protein n=1 Tax=Ruegeria faecimaris TaxID=686389 RepID=UPI002491E66D|nr:hypothetical protein [Ruegeria faecimaris]